MEIIIFYLGTILIINIWIVLLLGETGMLYPQFVWIPLLLSIFLITCIFYRRLKTIHFWKIDIIVLTIIIIIASFHTFFFHDIFFSNRDEGVYVKSSILAVKNHNFKAQLPENIFFITPADTNYFPFGYPAWLSFNYAVLGISGIRLSNFLLIILSLSSMYMITVRLSKKRSSGIISLALLASSFPYMWFFRRTVSENLALSFMLFGFVLLQGLFKKYDHIKLVIVLLSFGFIPYIRTDLWPVSFALLCFIFIYLLYVKKNKSIIVYFITLIPILFHSIYYIFYYKPDEINNIFSFIYSIGILKPTIPIFNDELPQVLPNALAHHLPQFVFYILNKYLLYLPILFVVISPIYLLVKRKTNELLSLLLITLTVLPLFIALKDPLIVYDQPWMLRRYLIGVLPLAFICFSLFITLFFTKRLYIIIFIIFLTSNMIISSPLFLLSEYNGTLENIGKIVQNIPKNSIIFTDRFLFTEDYEINAAIYSIYGMPSFGAYYDNIKNLLIPRNTNIYFVTHNNDWRNDQDNFSQLFPRTSWEKIEDQTFKFNKLLRTCELLKKYKTPGLVGRLTINTALEECSDTPSKVNIFTTHIITYKIDQSTIKNYLLSQDLLSSFGKRRLFFEPRVNYKTFNNNLVCIQYPCVIRYLLPNKNDVKGLLLFAKPFNYANEYLITIRTFSNDIQYNILNVYTKQYEKINPKYIKDGTLNFYADGTYFTSSNVDNNYISILANSSNPIIIQNIDIIPE